MNESLPAVTVIIPARPDQEEILGVAFARRLDYPEGKLEILVARGRQPSVQRNGALRVARGELIYFLDDDSAPHPGNLRRALAHFQSPRVVIVGGPNLCPPDAPCIEQCFAATLGSRLASLSSSARYRRVGVARKSGEKELILCNLIARKQPLLDVGGFNELLYPNEENALMDTLQKRGFELIYDPDLTVDRRPRKTLGAFCRMLLTYGRGRAEQFRSHPTAGSLLNFIPPLFLLYLAALPFLPPIALLPPGVYAAAVLAQAAAAAGWRHLNRAPAIAMLIVLAHVLYGAGVWRGMFTRLKAPFGSAGAVRIEVILPLASGDPQQA